MSMLPQPPPDAPAPPMSQAALRSRTWRRWIWGVGILSVILGGGFCFLFIEAELRSWKHRKYRNLAQAHSNVRQIGFALMEFEDEYGEYPGTATILKVPNDPFDPIPLGSKTSNDFFRQLLASKIAPAESMFHAWNPSITRKPDNRYTGKLALEKGECAFAYVAGLSSPVSPNTPMVLFPLVPGKKLFDYRLCEDSYATKAVICFTDLHVERLPVDKSGHVYLNGKDLFDPSQPFWGGKAPDVKWPE